MAKKYFLFLLVSVFLTQVLFAQRNVVNVDALTGRLNVAIPIYTLSSGSLSTDVSVVYGGSGVKVKDVEGTAGMSWQVTGGGQITRDLRGLPDDCKKDKSGNNRLGWIYNTNGTKINSLTIANTGTPNCTNEATDISSLNSNFSDLSDTEPDIFSVDAPGLSCSFVFDNSHAIKTIPYVDVRITYTTDPTTGAITGFTVVNDKGVQYTFGVKTSSSVRQTKTSVGNSATFNLQTVSESNIVYYKTQYYQFKYGVSYTSVWYLDKITDPNNNRLSFGYIPDNEQDSEVPLELYIGNTTKVTQYWTEDKSTPQLLSTIGSDNSKTLLTGYSVDFTYGYNFHTNAAIINQIKARGISYLLNYTNVNSTGTAYGRNFLREITTDQCNTSFQYHFSYKGESSVSGNYSTTLSDSASKKIDFWGYQNTYANTDLSPSLNINPSNAAYQRYLIATDNASRSPYTYSVSGADRRVDTSTVGLGALSQISYFDNGSTNLSYESNDYYDPVSGSVVQGGGIRVKQVTTYDGINAANNIVHTYTYTNPSTGLTSGKPLSLPVYGFTRPYTGGGSTADQWTASTVRSELDLSNDNHSIVYSHVTLSQTGKGKTLYEYYLPGTNFDSSASPSCSGCSTADWFPNMTNIARSSCVSAGFATNNMTTYPFAQATNYDFERGLIKKITNYKDDGTTEVSESNYTYQRVGTPDVITALKYDDNANVKAYLKYTIYASSGELSQQVSNKVFDLGSTTTYQQSAVNYYYGSSNHKQLTQSQSTKSDGTVENTYIKYSKDYTTSTINDVYVNALDQLKQQNINIPIETYTQVHPTSGSDQLISAELIKFKEFSFSYGANNYSLYLPSQRLKLVAVNGIAASGFTPSTVSSGLFTSDSKYIPVENDLVYDYAGYLQTSDDNRKHVQTRLADLIFHKPLLVAPNVSIDEIGYYSGSSLAGAAGFIKDNGVINATAGRTIQTSYALAIEAGATMSKAMKKNPNAKNYIFSAWIKTSVSGSLNLTLTTSASVSSSYPISFTTTSGNWKYFEIKVPVTSQTASFTASFQNTAGSSVAIDDVLLYPESTEISTLAYNIFGYKTAETNTNGVSNYFVNDALGRVVLVYDQDKQITMRKTYNYVIGNTSYVSPVFGVTSANGFRSNVNINFNPYSTYNPCVFSGPTFTWDFGDGSTPITVSTNTAQIHQYTADGTYTVTETVNVSGYGSKTGSNTVVIKTPPSVIPISFANNTSAGNITKITLSLDGAVVYTFTVSDLAAGTVKVPEGVYTVIVYGTGTIGSLHLDAGNGDTCLDLHLPSGKYAGVVESLAVGNSLSVVINDTGCN